MKRYVIGGKAINRICIVGGGNEGHYFMALLGNRTELEVSLLTSTPKLFQHKIYSVNTKNGIETVGVVKNISSEPSEIISDTDMIIFCIPSNAYKVYLNKIKKYVQPGTILGFVPGTGGVEFVTKYFLEIGCIIWGSQRVPSGTKIVKKGVKVESLGSRKDFRVACLPNRYTKDVCTVMGDLLSIKTIALPNYLSVTFTPSNPILHTSRLYALFHNYTIGTKYDTNLSFYKEWDNFSSEILLGCNDELQNCCRTLSQFDFSQVLSLREHYEIKDVLGLTDIDRMTNKIRNLDYLKDLVPMKNLEDGSYIPNFDSRYFIEDFPFGLTIIKSFCDICNINTPYIDKVLGWYDSLFNKKYYINGKFIGEGTKDLPIPQNFEITDISTLYSYYDKIEK